MSIEKNKVKWYVEYKKFVEYQNKIIFCSGVVIALIASISTFIFLQNIPIIYPFLLVFIVIATILSGLVVRHNIPTNIGTSSIGIHIQMKNGTKLIKWSDIKNIKLKWFLCIYKTDGGAQLLGFNKGIRQRILNEFESNKKIMNS